MENLGEERIKAETKAESAKSQSKALEERRMLAVHGHERGAVFFDGTHHERAAAHERLLIGERDLFVSKIFFNELLRRSGQLRELDRFVVVGKCGCLNQT